VVPPGIQAPEGKVRHKAKGNERSIDLGGLANQRLPKSTGKDFRQVSPIFDEKILDDEGPVVPDKEVVEGIEIEDRSQSGDSG